MFANDKFLNKITLQAKRNLNKNQRIIAGLENYKEKNEKEKQIYSKLTQTIKENMKKEWVKEELKKSSE